MRLLSRILGVILLCMTLNIMSAPIIAADETVFEKTDWAKADMLRTVPRAVEWLMDKSQAATRCSMCATPLAGHEKTHFTIITKDKKRRVACCAHCGLLMMHKLKKNAVRAVTPDFKTGQLINALDAFYVVDNDLVVCCYPSTLAFARREDAENFQKRYKGEVLTFQEALANMDKVMGKN